MMGRRGRILGTVFLAAALAAGGQARGQTQGPSQPVVPFPSATPANPELTRFLSSTPVTLLDWGMLRMERDLEETVRQLGLDRGREGVPRIGTLFRGGDRRVVAYASFAVSGANRTEKNCQDIFAMVREGLLSAAPSGASGAGWYLSRVFNSDFRRDGNQPEPFEDMLLDAVLLEVTLRVPSGDAFSGGPGRISCAGRLDSERASIVPPPQVPTQPRPQG